VNGKLTAFFFMATLFCVSFEKIQWELAGTVALSGIAALGFIASYTLDRLGKPARDVPFTAVGVLLFAVAFLLVYLIGFYNLESQQAAAQFAKGLARFAITFSYIAVGIVYLARKPLRFYWLSLGALCVGIAANAVYGIVQLGLAQLGLNLDQAVLGPLLGDARPINYYGSVNGSDVLRPNALTNDPNHLGIVLLVPLLLLTPLYLRLERGRPLRVALALLLPFLLLVELATLSRSALLGLGAGMLVLVVPYRRLFLSPVFLVPLGACGLVLAWIVSRRVEFFEVVVRSRLDTQTSSAATHFAVYELIGPALHAHALFGLGLNNFSVYYEAITGRTEFGPHSFYAALVIETGLVGAAVFAAFIGWLFLRLRDGHRLGKALAALRDPIAARVRPLAWGLTAAIVGVMVANTFYLTMNAYYFYVLAMFALALPVVFGRRLVPD
jgi:O-antigen ligase